MKRLLMGIEVASLMFICIATSALAAVVGDVNMDGKIGLMESVYALQVASGVYPTLDDSCLLTGKGEWKTGVTYNLCDVVLFSGKTYACSHTHTSQTGTIEPTNDNYWTMLSIKGDTGPPGQLGLYDNDGQFIGYSTGIVYVYYAGTSNRWYWGFYNADLNLSGLISTTGALVSPNSVRSSSDYLYYSKANCQAPGFYSIAYVAANFLGPGPSYYPTDKRDIPYLSFKTSAGSPTCNYSSGTISSYGLVYIDEADLPFTMPLSVPLVITPIP